MMHLSPENITLREAGISDLEKLRQLGKRTFSETFSIYNTEENMNEYLKTAFSSEKLLSELKEAFSKFYFAELSGQLIGYLKVNFGPAQTDIQDEKSLEIERIYVLKEFHGQQVGQLLYDKALEIAKARNLEFVWLGVWEKNPRAIRFYQKNGFVVFDKHTFNLGQDPQTDLMMKLTLTN